MRKVSLFFYLFFLSFIANAQNPQNEIPFRLTKFNNIVLPVILNNKDTLQLMFHTGSDYNSIIEKSLPKFKTIELNDTIKDVTSWAGYSDQAMSFNNLIILGKKKFKKTPIFIDQQSGHETDGKIGMKYFENKYLEIDFDSNKLKVYDEMPESITTFQKLKSRYENQSLFFEAFPMIENLPIQSEFMFHTGYSGAIIFSDEYVRNNQLLEKIKPTGQTKFSDAAGNEIISKTAILNQLKINTIKFKNVPISYFDSQVKIQYINIFGGDLIKRFNWIFSPDFKTIYFKPNSHFYDSYYQL